MSLVLLNPDATTQVEKDEDEGKAMAQEEVEEEDYEGL